MTTQSSPTRTRNVVLAILAGGLLTSLSACGVTSSTAASPVSESQPITAAAGSPLVQCGMAQLTPRVDSGDPVLSRGNDFLNQMDQSQQVPPAVQKVYNVDVNGLSDTQKHEVLLFLSSLNECPDVSPQLQQSILDVFDQLTPQSVADSDSDSDGVASEVIRNDSTTYSDSSSDHVWADGDWNGHPWWFRPAWDHPVTEVADWTQWGTDRREGIIWRWDGHDWKRFGRPDNDPANRPWLPRAIGQGVFNPPARDRAGNSVPNAPVVPGSTQAPIGVVSTPTPAANNQSPQGVVRPQFNNSAPNSVSGTSAPSTTTGSSTTSSGNSTTGTTQSRSSSGSSTAAPPITSSSTSDNSTSSNSTNNNSTSSDSSSDRSRSSRVATESTSKPDDTSSQVRDRSSSTDTGSDSGTTSTRTRGDRQDPNQN